MSRGTVIVEALRKALGDDCDPALFELDDDAFCRLLFSNYRANSTYTYGNRLTDFGLDLMQKCFQSYTIKLPKEKWSMQDLLYLDRHSPLPYFLTKTKIILFDKMLALMLKMRDGDLAAMRDAET